MILRFHDIIISLAIIKEIASYQSISCIYLIFFCPVCFISSFTDANGFLPNMARSIARMAKSIHPTDSAKYTRNLGVEFDRFPTARLSTISANHIRPKWPRLWSKLWPFLCGTRTAIRFSKQSNSTNQPSVITKRKLCPNRIVCRSSHNCIAHATERPEWLEQNHAGKRLAWVSASEQRPAALTQL